MDSLIAGLMITLVAGVLFYALYKNYTIRASINSYNLQFNFEPMQSKARKPRNRCIG